MTDLQLKKRIVKNPITTISGIVIAVATVWVAGGDWRANVFAGAVAIAGALMKHPGKKAVE